MKVTKTGFMLGANDMDRALRFYKDVIGLHVGFESPEWSEMTYGDATVALHGGKPSTDLDRTGLYFYVDDIEAACKEVEAAGGRVIAPPNANQEEGIVLAELADTEGNGFGLCQQLA